MTFHQGHYYFCESRKEYTIHVRKSKNILDIGDDAGVLVWTPPTKGPNCNAVWAPELHLLNGRWYIYFAADDGENENHRMWVLESETSDPQGAYRTHGPMDTDGWAIDGTVLQTETGLYFIWSGWAGKVNGQQNLYIAKMSNPWTISSERQLLTSPDQSWERQGMAICEGPQVLQRDGKVFIIYSASASWTPEYCLGLLVGSAGDPMNAASWIKRGPVFKQNEHIWGVGHCSFVKSPCQTQDWLLYHAKTKKEHGWVDRAVHAQQFFWDANGWPHFAEPNPVSRRPAPTRRADPLPLETPPALMVFPASAEIPLPVFAPSVGISEGDAPMKLA